MITRKDIAFLSSNVKNSIIAALSRKMTYPFNKPSEVRLSITTRCNARCVMCHEWKSEIKQDINFELAKKIIDDLHNWLGTYFLNLLGGEPLVCQNFFRIAEYAIQRGAQVGIVTNGLLLNQERAEKLMEIGMFNINLSLDGASPETHDYLRGRKGSFDQVCNAIEYLVEAKKKYNAATRIIIKTIIMGYNLNEIKKLATKFGNRKEVNGIIFQPVIQRNPPLPETLLIKESDVEKLNECIDELICMKNQGVAILNGENHLKYMKKYFSPDINVYSEKQACPVGYDNIFIDTNANVELCHAFPSIGNMAEQSVSEIFRSKKANNQRRLFKKCKRDCLASCYVKKSLRDRVQMFTRLYS